MPATEEELQAILAGTYVEPKAAPRAQPARPAAAPARAPEPKRQGFLSGSAVGRVVFGSLEDAANGAINAANDISGQMDRWTKDTWGLPAYTVFGRDADNGVIQMVTKAEAERRLGQPPTNPPPRAITPTISRTNHD